MHLDPKMSGVKTDRTHSVVRFQHHQQPSISIPTMSVEKESQLASACCVKLARLQLMHRPRGNENDDSIINPSQIAELDLEAPSTQG